MQREVDFKMERQPAEPSATSASVERFARLVMLSDEPMFAWRLAGSIDFWNTGAEGLYGFTSNEAVGRSSHALLQTVFPLDLSDLLSQLQRQRHWSGELRHTCRDGREVIVDSRMLLFGDETVLEVNRDVTKVKQVEQALRGSEQRLRSLASIVESSDDAIISKNLDGIITSWNKGAELVFGFTAEEAVGQPITIVIPKDRRDEERMILTRIRRGERIEHYETIRQRKQGGLITISLTVSPVKDAEGKIVGASKIARDISEPKRNQEQIVTLAREAEHRSKNILAAVLALTKLSQSDTPEGLKQAIEGRIRALANVHSLFVESRWIGAELSAVARQELAPYAEEARVRIDGPQVLLEPGTAQSIAVVLHELATNAAKYGALSTAKGRVALKWSHEADGRLILHWMETGGPPVTEPTRQGFGGRVIDRMIGDLKGKAHFDWHPDGLVCEISVQT